MAKELTEQDKQKIKDSVIASCISKGIKPTVTTSAGTVPNPLYASCVQLGYADAIKHASQGKLGLWFDKVNSFVQSQGGLTGMFKSASSIANQYRGNTPNMTGNGGYSDPNANGYQPGGYPPTPSKGDNMGMWFVLIILLIVLIIATVIYFNKSKNVATA